MSKSLIISNILNERNTADILIYLYLFGPKTRSEIYRSISTNPRMPIKIDLLEEHGLIRCYTRDQARLRNIELTPLGKRFAMSLCSLERILGGNVESFKWDILNASMREIEVART
jgi:DNA-binding MarR family transcriptional regulator